MQAVVTDNYDADFYERQREGSLKSAQAVLPVVFDLVKPASIVDFGCGVGTWLSAAKMLSVTDLLGLEGAWVKSKPLADPSIPIIEVDLEQPVTLPRRFDLAISLEVAEHLAPQRADTFVDDICKTSDIILFSAAAPGDDGDGHQNEQWPSYWAEKFLRRGYMPLDVIRPVISTNRSVDFWYRTNTVLYAKPETCFDILKKVDRRHLTNLDLPRIVEIVGLKRASEDFARSARSLFHWMKVRALERLR